MAFRIPAEVYPLAAMVAGAVTMASIKMSYDTMKNPDVKIAPAVRRDAAVPDPGSFTSHRRKISSADPSRVGLFRSWSSMRPEGSDGEAKRWAS